MPDQPAPFPQAHPVAPTNFTPPPRRSRGCLFPFVLLVLMGSLFINLVLLVILINFGSSTIDAENDGLEEKYLLGDKDATDKIAVVKMDGVIADSTITTTIHQLQRAAKDKNVKAVVLRIDSPGGSVSASDELYECIVNLRDDTNRRFKGSGPKPVVVSMGGVAASGGYYIAVAGSPILAERTTITGSIGVFAALPNVADLAKNNGVKLELIKAGDIKASGSFFHTLSQEERQTWQDTVDNAYDTFLGVIAKGRPKLTPELMRKDKVINREVPERDDKGNVVLKDGKPILVKYTRVRTDGGTFTAEQAKQFGLIDDIGDLPAAVKIAAQKVNLTSYRTVNYSKPPTLFSSLIGMQAAQTTSPLDPARLGAVLTPRLWYLVPSADGAILSTTP